MILSGDIGGTNTRLALFDDDLRPAAEKDYPSREHSGIEEVLRDFLAGARASVRAACLGVAGPVLKGICRTTNLPWTIDAAAISRDLGLPPVTLLNDLEAAAHAIPALGPDDLAVLNAGEKGAEGNAALIAAGTGLGEAGLFWDGREHRPFATEGGHASFAPRNDKEAALLRHLLAQFDTVSWERVVSGPGLHQIYRFLRECTAAEEPEWLETEMREGDPVAVIARTAISGVSPLCGEALDLFVSLYGAEAGNLALKVMATGGVYVAGGVAPKILPKLKERRFLESFFDKGRMRPLLEAMPVRVVLNERAALLGAARCALRGANPGSGSPSRRRKPRARG
jgi:glucokinase